MKKLIIPLVCVTLLLLAVPCFADLPGFGNSFTIDLYETVDNTPTGTATEFHSVLLTESVVEGNVWLWETFPANAADRTRDLFLSLNPATGELWGSDVLNFYEDINGRQWVSFWSDGADPADAPERSTNAVDFLEPLNGIYTYVAGANTYIIHSDANEVVPIPPSTYLLGSGLLGLIGLRRFRKV